MLAARVQASGVLQCAYGFVKLRITAFSIFCSGFSVLVWFFQEQTQGNFCTHGCYRCRQCVDCHDDEFLKWLLVTFVQLLNFFEQSLQCRYKNKLLSSLTFQFFTTLAFKTMIYVSKMEIVFALIFWEIIFNFGFVRLFFRTDQNLLFSLTIWIS